MKTSKVDEDYNEDRHNEESVEDEEKEDNTTFFETR